MAIAFVQKTAKFTASAASSVTSANLTTTAGNFGVVTCATWHSGAYTVTVTDSKLNTWAAADLIAAAESSAEGRIIIAGAQLTTAGATHNAICTSSSGTEFEGNFTEFSGIATSSPTDQKTTNPAAAASTSNTVTTSATSQADELVVAAISLNGASVNVHVSDPPTGYTSIGVQQSTATEAYEAAYKIVSATGAQSSAWTYDSIGTGTIGAVITYKAAAAGGATRPVKMAGHWGGYAGLSGGFAG